MQSTQRITPQAKALYFGTGELSLRKRRPDVRSLQCSHRVLSGRVQELERNPLEERSHTGNHGVKLGHQEPFQEPVQDSKKFDWLKTWYPVAIEKDLPTDRPVPVRLLGNPVVLWKDGQSKWRAFKDQCPHRLVPLSEGRVENGNLVCSYHGWEFEGSGKLGRVPQIDDDKSMETAKRSQRSCCNVHPCKEVDGLVWVYGSCEPGAEQEAATTSMERLRIPPMENGITVPWFMRDLPYGVDTFVENVLDPAHVPHSHHGVQGDRFKLTKMGMQPAEKLDADAGFTVTAVQPKDTPDKERIASFPYDLTYKPPSLVKYNWSNGNLLAFHGIPTDPGRSRVFFTAAFSKPPPKGPAGLLMKLIFSKWGLWIDHFTRNKVLDGDGVFLSLQSRETAGCEASAADVGRSYYMPTSQDCGVLALRRWLAKHADPIPWGPGSLDPALLSDQPRSELLNRYTQHVQHCPSCSKAHAVVKSLRWVAAAAAVLAACGTFYTLGSGVSVKKLILPVLVTLLSAALAWTSQNLKKRFEFEDYRHPDH